MESKTKNLTPIKAIRKNCLDCSGGSVSEVRECIITDCALFPYRLGRNPNRKGIKRKEVIKSEIIS